MTEPVTDDQLRTWFPTDEEIHAANGNGAGGRSRGHDDSALPIPAAETLDLVATEFGSDRDDALDLGRRIEERRVYEHITVIARRLVRDEQLTREADLDHVDVTTAAELITRERPPRQRVLGDLVLAGHNVTVVARFKAGKSTLVENMAAAAVTPRLFLGRYPVADALRATLLNFELNEEDMSDRIAGMHLDPDALERLQILNLRGHRLPIMAAAGRSWLAERIGDHGSDLLIVDPFGAAFAAAGGDSENDNAEVRRFTNALDEVKRLAGCPTLIMPVHTGRMEQHEGDERGRGATVLDDWPDVRMLLTVNDDGNRFLRTDGRAYCLSESRLGFEESTRRLMLATTDIGLNRKAARRAGHQELVVRLVKEAPGVKATELRDLLGANNVGFNDDKTAAMKAARDARQVHVHTVGRSQLHYAGPPHLDDEECPEGWTP